MRFDIFEVSTLEGKQKYEELTSLLKNSPYQLLDYIKTFSGNLDKLFCFLFFGIENRSTIIMLGYLNPIIIGDDKTKYFDFITPYGYSGPIFSKEVTSIDINNFWQEVDKWYSVNNVISEFIRFNLSGNHIGYSGSIFPTMLNIKGRIIEEDIQWKSFDRKVRKNVNKAKREKLYSKLFYKDIDDNIIEAFYDIYIDTMCRTNANKTFFYSLDAFDYFIKNNKDNCAICIVYHKEIAITSELLLISNDTIYSFLGGTDDKYFDKRPNDFLKFEVINWARFIKKQYYVLGGGYGLEDGIFRYKKCFFPKDVVDYYTGRKIINQEVYDSLIVSANIIRESAGLSKVDTVDTSFFPLYNKIN